MTESEKRNKNILKGQDNRLYYKINENEIIILPEISKRTEILQKAHRIDTAHRGRDNIIAEIKKEFCWPKLKQSVEEVIKNCEECVKNNSKIAGDEEFVKTSTH